MNQAMQSFLLKTIWCLLIINLTFCSSCFRSVCKARCYFRHRGFDFGYCEEGVCKCAPPVVYVFDGIGRDLSNEYIDNSLVNDNVIQKSLKKTSSQEDNKNYEILFNLPDKTYEDDGDGKKQSNNNIKPNRSVKTRSPNNKALKNHPTASAKNEDPAAIVVSSSDESYDESYDESGDSSSRANDNESFLQEDHNANKVNSVGTSKNKVIKK